MDRRSILAAIPALAAVPAIGADAQLADTPIMALFREWQDAYERANDDECYMDICDALRALEREISLQPSRTTQDLAAKIIAVSSDGDFDMSDTGGPDNPAIWAEMRALVGKAELEGDLMDRRAFIALPAFAATTAVAKVEILDPGVQTPQERILDLMGQIEGILKETAPEGFNVEQFHWGTHVGGLMAVARRGEDDARDLSVWYVQRSPNWRALGH